MGRFNDLLGAFLLFQAIGIALGVSPSNDAVTLEIKTDDDAFWLEIYEGKLMITPDGNTDNPVWTSENEGVGQSLFFYANGNLELKDGNNTVLFSVTYDDETSACKPTSMELLEEGDKGVLALVCANGDRMWDSVKLNYIKRREYTIDERVESCFYPGDVYTPDPAVNLTMAEMKAKKDLAAAINKRCRKVLSMKTVAVGTSNQISVSRQRCGIEVYYTDDINQVKDEVNTKLCYSEPLADGAPLIGLKLVIEDLPWTAELGDIRRPKFANKKRALENELNQYLMQNDYFFEKGFEILIISDMVKAKAPPAPPTQPPTAAPTGRKKRASDDEDPGTQVEVIFKFKDRTPNIDLSGPDYTQFTENMRKVLEENQYKNKYDFDRALNYTLKGCAAPKKLKPLVPEEIWAESEAYVYYDEPGKLGDTIHFRCPTGKMLSFDNDGFRAGDDLYTIRCDTIGDWKSPTLDKWPTCVKSCEVDLKTPPAATYLQPVPQKKRVPSGQYAKYECIDSELGVERGESKYYNILCMGHGEYDYPPAPEYWPVCRSKTTTFAPVVVTAVNMIRDRKRQVLESQYKVAAPWKEGEAGYEQPDVENWFLKVTIPAIVTMAIVILLCCLCVQDQSPCCNICSDEFRGHKKIIVPIRKATSGKSTGKSKRASTAYSTFSELP